MKTAPWGLILLVLLTLLACPALAEQADAPAEYVQVQPESYTCDTAPGSTQLLQAYIDELSGSSGLTLEPRYSGSRLLGRDGTIYTLLAPQIHDVANGLRASTQFTFTLGELGFPSTLTAEDLGVSALFRNGRLTEEASQALQAYLSFDLSKIVNALLADYPYAMYWCDKTQPIRTSNFGYSYDGRAIYFNTQSTITFFFPVIAEYGVNLYTFDTSVSRTVQAAISRAAQIVAKYANLSDVDKLEAYRKAICDLTSYNNQAASGSVSYGNPWQLIWVFDGNANTKVVCEGYAKAFQYLCSISDFRGNVKCWSVTGTMDGQAHMWNLVRLSNDQVYLADVTNSDSGTIGSSGQLFLAGYYAGDCDSGYVIRCTYGKKQYTDCTYVYDASARALFSRAQLTLAPADYADDDQTAVDDGEFNPAHWQYTSDGLQCTITGYTGPGGRVVIPREIDGCPVTAIAPQALAGNQDVTEIVMRDGIVTIGAQAFCGCAGLESVTIPGSVMVMGEDVFQRCGLLTNVTLGEGLTEISSGAFRDCASLASIALPATLETIGSGAFEGCAALQQLIIPAGVTLIESTGSGYFHGCTALAGISVAAGNEAYKTIDRVLFSRDGSTLLCCPPGMTGAYEIPQGVKKVNPNAFHGAASLSSITIPDSVTDIDDHAFDGCGDVPLRCSSSSYAAQWARSHSHTNVIYTDVAWSEPVYRWAEDYSTVTATRTDAADSSRTESETVSTRAAIGKSPTETGMGETRYTAVFTNSAFETQTVSVQNIPALGDMNLLRLPAAITAIEAEAFMGLSCQGAIIPAGCKTVDSRAFADCKNLLYVRVSPGTAIADDAFAGCDRVLIDRAE